MAEFAIDPRILSATEPVAALKLSDARLQLDARWPWIVLAPRKPGVLELEHLSVRDRAVLMEEIVAASAAVRAIGASIGRPVDKINVGALGNKVRQLHVHVVGRRADDAAWPEPVWGMDGAQPYPEAVLAQALAAAVPAFESVRRK